MPNLVYIATSLDGYIAGPNGEIDWLDAFPTDGISEDEYGFTAFMKRVDALLMGRNTFEKVLTFEEWPYEKQVFVLSNSMEEIPAHLNNKAEIVSGSIKKIVRELTDRGFHNLYIDGGQVIQSFLQQDLIDEMFITRLPILLGSGIPLFGALDQPLKFSKVETITLNQYLVMSHYLR